jgi:hypothetical protein
MTNNAKKLETIDPVVQRHLASGAEATGFGVADMRTHSPRRGGFSGSKGRDGL